jgi:hypothetical protein
MSLAKTLPAIADASPEQLTRYLVLCEGRGAA